MPHELLFIVMINGMQIARLAEEGGLISSLDTQFRAGQKTFHILRVFF